MSRVAKKAAKHFRTVARLQSMTGDAAVGARAELRKMREVRYSTDKPAGAGQYMNPTGKQFAR